MGAGRLPETMALRAMKSPRFFSGSRCVREEGGGRQKRPLHCTLRALA